MTISKKDNSSNKNNNKNTFYNFMPHLTKEEKCFSDTITNMSAITVSKSKKGGGNKTTTEKISFPRFKPVEQRVYEAFMTKITNPLTGEFYPERDTNGDQINQPNGSPNAKYVVHTIVRLKRFDGSEVLYTQGQLQGFNSLGSPITTSISKPETWNRTTFFNERRYDEKSQLFLDICKGSRGIETIYELLFTPDNVDKLYYGHGVGVNGNRLVSSRYNNPGRLPNLYVKDERTSDTIVVQWSDPKTTLNLFKTKDFYYLFNGDYIPSPVKAEIREKARSAAKQGLPVIENPRLEDPNNRNNNYSVDKNGEVDKYHDKSKNSYVG